MTIITCNSGRHKMRVPKEVLLNSKIPYTRTENQMILLDDQNPEALTSTDRTGNSIQNNRLQNQAIRSGQIVSESNDSQIFGSQVTSPKLIEKWLESETPIAVSICSRCSQVSEQLKSQIGQNQQQEQTTVNYLPIESQSHKNTANEQEWVNNSNTTTLDKPRISSPIKQRHVSQATDMRHSSQQQTHNSNVQISKGIGQSAQDPGHSHSGFETDLEQNIKMNSQIIMGSLIGEEGEESAHQQTIKAEKLDSPIKGKNSESRIQVSDSNNSYVRLSDQAAQQQPPNHSVVVDDYQIIQYHGQSTSMSQHQHSLVQDRKSYGQQSSMEVASGSEQERRQNVLNQIYTYQKAQPVSSAGKPPNSIEIEFKKTSLDAQKECASPIKSPNSIQNDSPVKVFNVPDTDNDSEIRLQEIPNLRSSSHTRKRPESAHHNKQRPDSSKQQTATKGLKHIKFTNLDVPEQIDYLVERMLGITSKVLMEECIAEESIYQFQRSTLNQDEQQLIIDADNMIADIRVDSRKQRGHLSTNNASRNAYNQHATPVVENRNYWNRSNMDGESDYQGDKVLDMKQIRPKSQVRTSRPGSQLLAPTNTDKRGSSSHAHHNRIQANRTTGTNSSLHRYNNAQNQTVGLGGGVLMNSSQKNKFLNTNTHTDSQYTIRQDTTNDRCLIVPPNIGYPTFDKNQLNSHYLENQLLSKLTEPTLVSRQAPIVIQESGQKILSQSRLVHTDVPTSATNKLSGKRNVRQLSNQLHNYDSSTRQYQSDLNESRKQSAVTSYKDGMKGRAKEALQMYVSSGMSPAAGKKNFEMVNMTKVHKRLDRLRQSRKILLDKHFSS